MRFPRIRTVTHELLSTRTMTNDVDKHKNNENEAAKKDNDDK